MDEKIKRIAEYYEYDKQKMQLFEEMGELMSAISKHERACNGDGESGSLELVAGELVDVGIMIEQIAYLLGIKENHIETVRKYKLDRQLKRIREKIESSYGDDKMVTVVYGTHGIRIGESHKVYCWRVPETVDTPEVGSVVKVSTAKGVDNAHVIKVEKMAWKDAKKHKAVIGKAEWK